MNYCNKIHTCTIKGPITLNRLAQDHVLFFVNFGSLHQDYFLLLINFDFM